ncbi:MAG TPA: class I SAM-dependent methyltransferase, partial [Candidatus Saccharimonadales bacterium]|nr:class I SAM-dependent methyltransferase [Candidatus Saccharimonadales bacterium]
AILEGVRAGAPVNVEFVAGDATRLDEIFGSETFDAVYSYWLLPHLSIDSPKPAKAAAKAMFDATKNGGTISAGPQTSNHRLLTLKSGPALKVVKDGSYTVESYADTIVAATNLPTTPRCTQKLANEVATQFFGTTRYARQDGRLTYVYHPQSGEYVSLLSGKGVTTVGRLAIALARHGVRQYRSHE